MPAEQTKQGWRTRSTPHGASNEYSEISIDDQIGQELMYLQAQKDQRTYVKNDQNLKVDNMRTVRIGASETKTIGDSYSLTTETGSASITAATMITLRVADNVIMINDEGIFINGTMINLSAEAAVSVEAPEVDISAASTTIDGGMLEVEVGLFLSEPLPEVV
ncbi:MAG: bacteriophage T4 gp5 trimerization domain-containing protein [Rhodopila sp.]